MTPSLHRRRLLAAAVPGVLAGCLVESSGEDEDGDSGDGEDDGNSGDGGEASASESESETGDDGERESLSEDEESAVDQADEEVPPDEVGPDGSGLVVRNVDVRGVNDDGYETTVRARLVVENAGGYTYGTIELRADAYATRPNSPEREAVGRTYVTRRFPSGDRFDGGTRRFDVAIEFRSGESPARADPDWYEIDAAVRRAEPV